MRNTSIFWFDRILKQNMNGQFAFTLRYKYISIFYKALNVFINFWSFGMIRGKQNSYARK